MNVRNLSYGARNVGFAIAAIFALAFSALSLTGCKQPTDSSPVKTLVGITLNTATVKKSYTQNETLNLSGLVVTATYSDASTAAVTNYTANPTDGATLATIGNDIKVTISFSEGGITKTADFSVTVAAPIPDNDITYTVAQTGGTDSTADSTGIVFTFNGSVSGLTADHITLTNGTGTATKGTLNGSGTSWTLGITVTTAGNITVAIAKTGIEAETKNVTLFKQGQTTLTGITLNTDTVKKSYTQNETLNLSGLVVTASYNNSTSAAVTTYTSNPQNNTPLNTVGNNITVTITYTEGGVTQTATFAVTVNTPHLPGITITVKQIEDETFVFPDITISRTGSNDIPVTKLVEVENASGYSGIEWEVAGVGAGQTVTGSDASFTLDAQNVNYNSLGGHVLILTVTKGTGADAVQYIRAIPFTVVQ